MTKALVFGGAFNPPTIAHIQLADYARKQIGFDKVIFVPSKMTYIQNEQKKNYAIDDQTRLFLLRKIADAYEWMEVSDFEITSEVQPRTYKTLSYLRKKGYQCMLLFGSDKLLELETGWMHIDEICQEFGIVCMKRSGDDCASIISNNAYLRRLKPYITLIETPDDFQSVSSSTVRNMIANGQYEKAQTLLPQQINISEIMNEKQND